jgi:arginine decarboxylase
MLKDAVDRWTVTDASELYEVPRWGKGYFSVNNRGHLQVHPTKEPGQAIDMQDLIERLQLRGLDLPILLRFNGILKDRLREINDVFAQAIKEHDYKGRYICVYPIKVNQQRHVVEQVVSYGRAYGFGLEAGSKPEMLAVVAMTDAETPIICNGFKDAEFIEMAMLAQKMGRKVIPVVEKYTELALILKYAEKVGVRPQIGMRIKLAARGSGRWQSSGGFRSKFGLTVSEILHAVDELKSRDMLDCFKLLHFHLGSQITNIRHVKTAVTEAARAYADLQKRGAGLEYLDIGGGLGVDYDGSQTNFESSVNYSLQEYAADVVHHVQAVCEESSVPHPTLISESGRAVVAYHSCLVFGTLGVAGQGNGDEDLLDIPADSEQPLHDLVDTYKGVTARNALESFHDAQQAMDVAMTLFSTGYLALDQRALAENLFWAICRKIKRVAEQLDYVPEELEGLDMLLSDTYFCNFSLFQSMPDSWAIKQLFPIMPIHRLNEKPTRNAVLADITCDSDGKIDRFVSQRDPKRTLELHELRAGEEYYLAAFLVGAYQETLGDLHNLFGDTHVVHIRLHDQGGWWIEEIVKGDTAGKVLSYMQYDVDRLFPQFARDCERAVRENRLTLAESQALRRFYESELHGYTYLEPD